MEYAKPYIEYLVYFHGQRDYFECHEVLEEHWKSEGTIQGHYWVGLIQIAVSLYHHRRKNFAGAEKMMNSAIENIKQNQSQLPKIGLDPNKLLKKLEDYLSRIQKNEGYVSMNLPIADPELLNICKNDCEQRNLYFGNPSKMNDEYLIHKHKLRDRSEIITERETRLKNKSKLD